MLGIKSKSIQGSSYQTVIFSFIILGRQNLIDLFPEKHNSFANTQIFPYFDILEKKSADFFFNIFSKKKLP